MTTTTERVGPGSVTGPRAPRTARGAKGAARRHLLGYALVTPIVAVMVVTIGYPLIRAVITSFQDQRIIGNPADFVGFDTYAAILNDPGFWQALERSAIWLFLNLIVQTILGFGAALLLQRRNRWSKTARTWIVLPWAIPSVAVTVLWQWMLNTNYGVVYSALQGMGIDVGAPFGNSSIALFAIILVNSWHWFPLTAVVLYGALSTVPPELIEAAKVDGASSVRAFFSITLPTLQPVLFALGLVGSLWSFNILDTIYLITKGGPVGATTTMPVYIYNTAFKAFHSSQAAAASIVTVLVLVVAVAIFVRVARPKED